MYPIIRLNDAALYGAALITPCVISLHVLPKVLSQITPLVFINDDYKHCFYTKSYITILTSCNHDSFLADGLARTWHSKYTSSPSLMSLAASELPRRSHTTGGSTMDNNLKN